MYWNSESPSTPIRESTASGSRVTVITTMRYLPGKGSRVSSGYPRTASSSPVSIVLRSASIPPRIFPESV